MEKQLVKRFDQLFRIVRQGIPGSKIDGRADGGRFGGSAGIVKKITLLAKLARLSEVSEEKIPNCGPSAFSPGTLTVGG
jgi:hypothetical protein